MSKHTPGPWALDHENDHVASPDYHSISAGCGYHTGPEDIGFSISGCISTADARLMTAAPDLLADLSEAAATLRRYEALHRAKGTAESTAKAEVNAELATRFEATIAKATVA